MSSRLLRLQLVSFLAAASLEAQTPALEPGTWVRVWAGQGRTVGVLVGFEAGRLRIARGARSNLSVEELRKLPPRDTVSVSMARLTLIEVYGGRRSRAGAGALIGFATGFAFGTILGALGCGENSYLDCSRLGGAAAGGAAVGAVGAGVGALAGLSIRSDRWRAVPVSRASPSVVSLGQGRVGMGVAISF